MPRQSRSRPSQPRSAPTTAAKSQTRSASTTATPPVPTQAPPAPVPHPGSGNEKQPGMIAQMAATAGSVAIGSTMSHGISSILFGGSSVANSEPVQQAAAAPIQQPSQGASCEIQAKDFTKCLDAADIQTCAWYLEQLQACQAAARPY